MTNTNHRVAPGNPPVQQPPPLDTINTSGIKNISSADSQTTASNTSSSESKGMASASPRSINNMKGFHQDGNGNTSGSVGIPSGRSRRSNRDNQSHTDGSSKHGSNQDPPTQIQFGNHGMMVVPSTIIGPPPRVPSPYNMSPVGMPTGHGHSGHHSHRRAESWSGQFPPMCPPSPGHYSVNSGGHPSIPFLNNNDHPPHEMNPLLGGPPSSASHQNPSSARRKRKSTGSHRRSHSSGAAYPGMPPNAHFFPPDMPPPPPPRTMEKFSPRGDFMKLTGSFRSTPDSPSGRKVYQGMPPSPSGTPRSISGKVSFSPHVGGHSPSGYGAINVTNSNGSGMPDFPAVGGEAVFLAQKNSGGGRSHRESSRKRHMRQQSAQLFMEEVKGIEQPLQCRDVVFLLLFLFHIVGIAFLGTTYGHDAMDIHSRTHNNNVTTPNDLGDEVELYFTNMLYVAGLSGLFSLAFSLLAFGLMTVIARKFVQVALCLAITISFAWGTIGTGLSPKNVVPITGFVAFALSVAYAFIVWERIPFCASNLVTALSGLRANMGTVVIAISFQVFSVLYFIYFTFVVVGVYDAIQEGKLDISENMQAFVYTMMGISFYWTFNVILNVVQVTTASVISDWWYHPEDVNVFNSFSKIFYSLGSICFGSLLVGPVRLIRQLSAFFRPNGDSDSALMCMHQCLNFVQTCLTSCVDGLATHFNSWAFTYVGIYGYGFMDAGGNATELFGTRGWTMIVTDDLVPNILLMMSLVIGGATGLFAYVIEDLEGAHISSLSEPGAASFGMGVVVGLVVTSVLFGVVSSSVNAVLVCFAASPVDFENNHPELSHEMRSAWREVWPGCMDVVDLRVALANPSPHSSSHGGRGSINGIPAEFL